MPQPRKSIEQHRLNGTTPEYAGSAEPLFAGGKPKMPKDLSPVAAAEWKRLVRELAKRETLTKVDSSALEIYATTFARWKACVSELEKYGPVVETTWTDQSGNIHTKRTENPASKIAGRLENSMRAMLKEFSATPASREKTRPTKSVPKPDEYPVGSVEWLKQELKRQQVTEQTLTGEPSEPEPETDLAQPINGSLEDFDENAYGI